MDFLKPKEFNLPEVDDYEDSEGSKLARILRNIQLNGNAMDVGKAGVLMQGRLGYQTDPNDSGNNFGVGVSGQRFARNTYNIPAVVNGVDLSYGNPNQNVTVGYYPNKSQFMGEPIGKGGFSILFNKSFD